MKTNVEQAVTRKMELLGDSALMGYRPLEGDPRGEGLPWIEGEECM